MQTENNNDLLEKSNLVRKQRRNEILNKWLNGFNEK